MYGLNISRISLLDTNNIELLKIKMGNCEVSLAERYTNTFSYYSITDQQVKNVKEKMQNSCYGGMAMNNII